MAAQRYWQFDIPVEGRRRWEITCDDEAWIWPIRVRLREGKRMASGEWSVAKARFTYSQVAEFEDIPRVVGYGCMLLCSDRLRAFFEAEAPGAAEYLPIRIDGPRSREMPGPYWAVNMLRLFDCLDEKESMDVDENGKRFVQIPVVDISRVPSDGVLGLLKGYQVVRLIRNDLRLKFQKAGFTGAWFQRIAEIDRSARPRPAPSSTKRPARRR